MTEENKVIEHDDILPIASTSTSQQLSPLQQMQQAKDMGMSVDEMKEMMTLQKEFEANEARKAFHLALAEFKKNPPKVYKDLVNTQYGSGYTSIGNMVNSVNEAMGPYGLNARWDYPETNGDVIIVTCILSHAMGHEERVTLSGPIDVSGTKNPLQARKSTRTYLKLETFEAVTGMASIQGNLDDDANASAPQTAPVPVASITEAQSNTIHAKITDNDLDMDIILKWLRGVKAMKDLGVTEIVQIPSNYYDKVIAKIDGVISKKKSAAE